MTQIFLFFSLILGPSANAGGGGTSSDLELYLKPLKPPKILTLPKQFRCYSVGFENIPDLTIPFYWHLFAPSSEQDFQHCKRVAAFDHLHKERLHLKGELVHSELSQPSITETCEFEVVGLLPKDHPLWSDFVDGPAISLENADAFIKHQYDVLLEYQTELFENVKFTCLEDLNS